MSNFIDIIVYMKLRNNPQILAEMGRASRACAPDKALDIIYNTIKEVSGK